MTGTRAHHPVWLLFVAVTGKAEFEFGLKESSRGVIANGPSQVQDIGRSQRDRPSHEPGQTLLRRVTGRRRLGGCCNVVRVRGRITLVDAYRIGPVRSHAQSFRRAQAF